MLILKKKFGDSYYPALGEILHIIAVLKKYFNIFKPLFDGTQFCIKINSRTTDLIKAETGVRQGDISSDDLALFDRSCHSIQLTTSNLKDSAEKVGLRISGKKRKI